MLTDNNTLVRFTLAVLVALGALLIGENIFLGEYLTTDENSYMFQAWLFLQGEIRLACPPLEDAFFHRMIICDDQVGWVSRYPPGHSAWLMPGVALGYPRLMTAVAAFLSIWFISKAGERLDIPAWITGLLLIISPYFWLMWGSVLSHTSGLAATALMLWAYLAWVQERRTLFAAIAGLAWAFLFLNRSYTALWVALPFGVDALLRLAYHRNRVQLSGTALFASCSAMGILLYLLYNHTITGNALLPPFLHYNPSEGPGFGLVNGKEHTLATGWSFLKYNFSSLNINLWGFPGSLLVLLALTVIGWRKNISPLLLCATLLVWISYSAFWFRGILELPPIYYYETLVFVTLLAAMGLQRLFVADWTGSRWTKPLVAGLIIASVLPPAIKTFDSNAEIITRRNHYTRQFQHVIRDVPPRSIVVLRAVYKDILAQNSWNPKGLDSDPLILRDVHGVVPLIPRLFPDRPIYLVSGLAPMAAQALPVADIIQRTITAAQMHASTGELSQHPEPPLRYAQAPDHKKGRLGSGIRQYLLPGHYEVVFTIKASGRDDEQPGLIEVINRSIDQTLASQKIQAGDKKAVLEIEVDKISMVEPQVIFSGKGRLEFDQLEIREVQSRTRSAFLPETINPLISM